MLMFLTNLQNLFAQRLRSERGATAVEYGLIVALVAVVIIAGITLLGANLNTLFNTIGTKIGNITP
jgi:pilus assembly protein Flp/PilA